jgi:hypothetical protein
MDTRKVLFGTLIWSLGLFLPVLFHALLMNAAVKEENYSYAYDVMVKYFFHLPWILWLYLSAMAVVGTILVISGLRNAKDPSADHSR